VIRHIINLKYPLTIILALLFPSIGHSLESSILNTNPDLDWKTFETKHFRIHYHRGLASIASKTAELAEKIHDELTTTFDWNPGTKTELVLRDDMDFPNGAATPVPFNTIHLLVTPPSKPQIFDDFDDWLKVLITHEYTHVIHTDKASDLPLNLRSIFGRFVLLFPNMLQPTWLLEGLATHFETDKSIGIGRGQSKVFEMMMRTEVANGLKPVSQINLPIRSWPGGVSNYLYGVYFYQFIEQYYGKESLLTFIESNSNNIIPFRVNSNTKSIFGKDMTELWSEYHDYLKDKFTPQLETIRANQVVTGQALTDQGFKSGAALASADGSVYFIKNNGYRQPALVRQLPNSQIDHLAYVQNDARLDLHEQAGILLSQPNNCDEYNFYFDIFRIAHNSEEVERLTHCARYIYSSWSPDGESIIAVHMSLGQSSLHLIDAEGKLKDVLWDGKNEEVLGQIDWSPDGKQLVASIWRAGNWNLESFDLQKKKWHALTSDHWVEAQPRFTSDGKFIVFSANFNGVYNIYLMDVTSGLMSQLTNVVGGAFEPDLSNGILYFTGYNENGFDLYKIAEAKPIAEQKKTLLEPANKGISKKVVLRPNAIKLTTKAYSPWSSLRPRWIFPSLEITSNDGSWIGAVTGGNDALRVHSYLINALYEIETNSFSSAANYIYNDRISVDLFREADVDFDDNEQLDSIRISNEFQFTYGYPFLSHDWHIMFNATVEDQFFDYNSTVSTSLSESKDRLIGVGFEYNNSKRFNFSISPSSGRHLKLTVESSDLLESDFSGEVFTLDWREYIQMSGEHVLALRMFTGRGTNQPNPFRLGGATSKSSETGAFNVREYNLRGYNENEPELSGRRMQLFTSEWRFPVALIERSWMAPPLGVLQVSGSLFYESGATWNEGHSADRYYRSTGGELIADLNLFYQLDVNLRLGYARGLDDTLGDKIFYFSVVSSF
jgi:hypothetical protein